VVIDKVISCGKYSMHTPKMFRISGSSNHAEQPLVGLPHTLEQLLPKVAEDGVVVLTGVLGNYHPMLMSWVCRLRELGIRNLVVAAFDEEAYRAAALAGLAVYLSELPDSRTAEGGGCEYGSTCFRAATKAKSRAALEVLRKGYDVLYSDSDMLWFSDPRANLKALSTASNGALLVQSNEPNHTSPANGPRRINSGFYYAAATPATITALEAITEHALKSRLSEQPSFFDVLCGEQGEFAEGDSACQQPGGMRTVFLDRDVYPNGKHRDLWDAPDVQAAAVALGASVLHNNWIVGEEKVARQRKHHWRYDDERKMCIHPWASM
jgi:hypothetical protein